jgi:hypothetical protein
MVFTKNFSVKSKDLLEVNTQFTDIVFQVWDRNEIDFSTTIKIENGTGKEMEKVVKGVNIVNYQIGNKTFYKLTYKSPGTNNIAIRFSLIVQMPKDIFLDITTSFGDIEGVSLLNNFNANVEFGDVTVDNLGGNKNTIKLRHGKIKMEQVNNLSLNAQFFEGTINEIGTLRLDSRYGTLKIDKAKTIEVNSAHDNISIRTKIDKIEGKMDFGTLKIKSLHHSCVFTKFSFSDIKIEEILPSFKNITVFSAHSTIVLNVPRDQSFTFDFSGNFSTFKNDDLRLTNSTVKAGSNSVKMQGFYGKNQDSGKLVKIEASFGSVSLFE